MERHRFDFSFSGLKTAVARWVEARERSGEPVPVADVAASFQEAVCDVLTRKALDACRRIGCRASRDRWGSRGQLPASPAGRVAGGRIRHQVRVPRPGLCTDNGAMVAALGSELVRRDRPPSDARLRCRLVPADHPRRRLTPTDLSEPGPLTEGADVLTSRSGQLAVSWYG